MMDRNREFEGQSGIITGAASGIGAATAEILARRGANVVLADINGTMLEEKSTAPGAGPKGGSAFRQGSWTSEQRFASCTLVW